MPLYLRESKVKILCLLFLSGLLGLSGCDSSEKALADGGYEQVSHAQGSLKNDFVGPSHQNPGASVRLLTQQIFIEALGEINSSELKLQVAHPRGSVSIRFAEVEGLDVVAGKDVSLIDLETLDPDDGGIINLPISLYAPQEGRHYLPLSAIVVLPNRQRLHRSMSVVVQVGKQMGNQDDLKKSADKVSDSTIITSSEKRLIKILPATETVY